jgi:hypothetical protein
LPEASKFLQLASKGSTERSSVMPRETVEIVLSEVDPYRGGALFLAALAYPDPRELHRRKLFAQAMIRWTLETRIACDPDWAGTDQIIKPGYFSGDQKLIDSWVKQGWKKLSQRFAAANAIAIPHFRAVETGRFERVEGFSGRVNDLAILGAVNLGMSEGSASTFKSRFWAPSRPVIHAATAYLAWHENVGLKPETDKTFAFLMVPEFVEDVVSLSEDYRAQLKDIEQFTIREENTIAFKTTRNDEVVVLAQFQATKRGRRPFNKASDTSTDLPE